MRGAQVPTMKPPRGSRRRAVLGAAAPETILRALFPVHKIARMSIRARSHLPSLRRFADGQQLSNMLSIASAAFAFQGSDLVTKFNEWKLTHAKTYASSDAEASALAAYASNEAIINEHNGKGSSYELGHNEFSDLTWDQFKQLHMSELFLNRAPKNVRRVHLTGARLPPPRPP